MRMWMVNPKIMCRQHLLGEHVEIHMFVGTLSRGKSVKGYLEKGLLEVHNLYWRHEELVEEMKRRGTVHPWTINGNLQKSGGLLTEKRILKSY